VFHLDFFEGLNDIQAKQKRNNSWISRVGTAGFAGGGNLSKRM